MIDEKKLVMYVKDTVDSHYRFMDANTGGFVDWMEFAREIYLMFYGEEE